MAPRRRRVSLRRVICMVTGMAIAALMCVHAMALGLRGEAKLAQEAVTAAAAAAHVQMEALNQLAHEALPRAAPQGAAARVPESAASGAAVTRGLGGAEVHVVFSTDCGGYQHWQSIAVWYSSRQAGHQGAVTRIASGCNEEQKAPIEKEYREIDASGEFRVHFAPKGELKGNYKYSNKPSGLYHWLCTAVPRPFLDESTGVVALIDPDQMLLRPITAAVKIGLKPGKIVGSLYDASGEPRVSVGRASEFDFLPELVVEGRPVAQEYGLGGAWGDAGKPHARPSWKEFDRARVCGKDALCTKTTAKDAGAHYAVGPPYLVQATDARKIADAWLRAVPEVHAQYPYLLAEMYAYSMAAANLSLPHAQVHHLMVSNVGAGGEGWDWVDALDASAVCAGAGLTTPPAATRPAPRAGTFSNDAHPPGPGLPSVLHFCQSYRAGGYKFGKHSVPHDIFSCDQGLFEFDPDVITRAVVDANNRQTTRNAFFLCNVIPRLNAALVSYKETVCPKRGRDAWNLKPSVRA